MAYGGPVQHAPATTPARPGPPGGVAARPVVAVVAALVALASAVGVWLLWRLFVDTFTGQLVEQAALRGADYHESGVWVVTERVLEVVSVTFIAAVLLAAVVVAFLRRRADLAVQVAVVMIGSNVTTQLVKKVLLQREELGVEGVYGNTLPSGHTTAAASAAVVLLLVVPPRTRPWAAVLGAAYAAVTGVATLARQWHRPSDVVAAMLVVLAWTALACAWAATRRTARPRSRQRGAALAASVLVAVSAGAGAVGGVVLVRTWDVLAADPQSLWRPRVQQEAFVGGVAAAVAACALGFALVLALRQATAVDREAGVERGAGQLRSA